MIQLQSWRMVETQKFSHEIWYHWTWLSLDFYRITASDTASTVSHCLPMNSSMKFHRCPAVLQVNLNTRLWISSEVEVVTLHNTHFVACILGRFNFVKKMKNMFFLYQFAFQFLNSIFKVPSCKDLKLQTWYSIALLIESNSNLYQTKIGLHKYWIIFAIIN